MAGTASSEGSAVPRAGRADAGGPGQCYPSLAPCSTPQAGGATGRSNMDLGSAWSQARNEGARLSLLHSACAHLRLPELLPSSWHTELLTLKNRFFPQIWSWCARLMENPSSCCCKTPFPWNEGKFYCTTEPAEGMHLQFILVPPGNSIWLWRVRAVTALGLLQPVREVLRVWVHSRDGGWSIVLWALV